MYQTSFEIIASDNKIEKANRNNSKDIVLNYIAGIKQT